MSEIVLLSIVTLCTIGIIAAVMLYAAAKKFKVYEDPRIDEVEAVLPSANCGGCGYPGCRGFAEALVKADDISGLYCPAGGENTMKAVAVVLGQEAVTADPKIAVVRCSGNYSNRARTSNYQGARNCSIAQTTYIGETDCAYGCLGFGDCVSVCNFGAISINTNTGLPVVIDDKCVACGACAKICPRNIIEMRKKGNKSRRIFVSCVSCDKGGIAKKACAVACIGCSKCQKVCQFEAIEIKNNLAYIDFNKCKLCRKCVEVCPSKSILELNFPPRKKIEAVENNNVLNDN